MDEVLKIKKELDKTGSKNDAKRALELLRSLESIPMTLDVLQKTHIGMAVNNIRKKVDDTEVNSLSKSMVKKWRKLVSSSSSSSNTTNPGGGGGSGDQRNGSNASNNSTSSSNNNVANNGSNSISANSVPSTQDNPSQQSAQPAPSSAASASYNDEYRNKAPRQTEVPVTTSEVRLKCRQLLTDALKKPLPKDLSQEAFLEEEILAARIEESIYQEFKSTDTKYKVCVRTRIANLGGNSNPYLRYNVLRGDIAPEKIAKMTHDEMASDELKKQRQQYTQEAINDHQMSLTSGTRTSEIKCPACKKCDTTYNQVQTRSADEPMTTFCFCNECGKRWKFC